MNRRGFLIAGAAAVVSGPALAGRRVVASGVDMAVPGAETTVFSIRGLDSWAHLHGICRGPRSDAELRAHIVETIAG